MGEQNRKNIKMAVVILILSYLNCSSTPIKSQRLSVWIEQNALPAVYKQPLKHKNEQVKYQSGNRWMLLSHTHKTCCYINTKKVDFRARNNMKDKIKK